MSLPPDIMNSESSNDSFSFSLRVISRSWWAQPLPSDIQHCFRFSSIITLHFQWVLALVSHCPFVIFKGFYLVFVRLNCLLWNLKWHFNAFSLHNTFFSLSFSLLVRGFCVFKVHFFDSSAKIFWLFRRDKIRHS